MARRMGGVGEQRRWAAFVTNQELTLAERKALKDSAKSVEVDLFHLERVTTILDTPAMAKVARQFLNIDYVETPSSAEVMDELTRVTKHIEAVHTGGDSFCYFMLYCFNMEQSFATNFAVIRKGTYTLYDVRLRIMDMDANRDVTERSLGELNAPATNNIVKWALQPSHYYRAVFFARNGSWHQDVILKRSDLAQCWLAATRVVVDRGGKTVFEHMDSEFEQTFGKPTWRP